MTFDFVIETPDRRGINRNNNKLIQKRATQAGAKTRLGKKSNRKSPTPDTSTIISWSRAQSQSESRVYNVLYANNDLSLRYSSPFLARHGDHGEILFVKDNTTEPSNTCFRLPRTSMSLLQRYLLDTAYVQPKLCDVNRMFKVMTLTQRSFLEHLPSHYGHVGFLDEAIDCVVARIHDTVPLLNSCYRQTVEGELSPTSLYGKALTSLRTAISEDLQKNIPYVWYAIMLLTLFELLSTGHIYGWLWHAEGSERILHKVGAVNIENDFLMSLLSSQCRIMVTEAIFSNKSCYLGNYDWQEALQRSIVDCDDFSERSASNIKLSMISARVPDVFLSVSSLVHQSLTMCTKSIKTTVQDLHADLQTWSNQWRDILELTCRDDFSESTIRHQCLTILLTYYMLLAIVCRLRISVSPSDTLDIEDEAVSACIAVLSLRRMLMKCENPSHSRGSIYCRTTAGTHATSASWRKHIQDARGNKTIPSDLFDQWCHLIGRQPYYPKADLLSHYAEELTKRQLSNT